MSFNFKNINLFCIARDILYNIWVVFLACVIAVCGSYVYVNFYHTPVYSSSMTVSINQKNSLSYTGAALTKTIETATVFQTLFQSDLMKEKIYKVTGEKLSGTVTAAQLPETNFITITATSDTPESAFKTLIAVYENYKSVTDYAFDDIVVYVLFFPSVPVVPSNSLSLFSAVKKTLPLAVLFVLFVIVLLSVTRDTVKNSDAAKDLLLLDVFTTVYHERKNKTLKAYLKNKNKKILLSDPLLNKSYIESFNKLSIKLEHMKRTQSKQIFMIASTNENEGKTTIAVNCSIALARRDYKVLLIDMDLRKPSVWRFFDKVNYSDKSRAQISDIVKKKLNTVDIVVDSDTGVHILAGKKSVSHSSEYLSDMSFAMLLEKLREHYDFIIIDTPPLALISDAELLSHFCDGVILVVKQDNSTIDAINDTVSALNRGGTVLGCVFNDVKTIGGVITGNYHPRSSSYGKYY